MKKARQKIAIVCFQIGVNIIGIPQLQKHYLHNTKIEEVKYRYHK